jgi:hypothetical protein
MGFAEALVNPPHGYHVIYLVEACLLSEHRPIMRIPSMQTFPKNDEAVGDLA